MLNPRISTLLSCAVLATLLAAPMSAQPSEGRIAGSVRSASGEAIPGATVTIVNQENAATRVVRSGANGAYAGAGPAPGLYAVSAELPGFRKVIERGRRLDGGATLTVDFTLELEVAGDVKVTARKRDETVSKTPFSIAAPTEEVLRDRGVENIEDVAANVAGFSVPNL